MPRKASIIFTPIFGCKYILKDKSGNKNICRVLGPNDKKKYGTIRSPRKCNRGEEFFKVILDGEIITMLNSNIYSECKSEDGKWTFTGDRYIEDQPVKKENVVKKQKKLEIPKACIEFINPNFNYLIKEIV